jgi:transcription initiation factor TFIIB
MRHRSSGVKCSNITQINSKTDWLGGKLQLSPATLGIAKDLLADLEQKDKLKGRSLESIIAAVFYFACRQEGIPRKLSQISKMLELDQKTVNKSFNMIKGYVNKKEDDQITRTVSGLVRLCCDIIQKDLNDNKKVSELKKYSSEICELICKKEIIAGRNPSTIAAASVLIASKLLEMKIAKKDIANSTSTTENTISNAYNELIKYKDYIIPEELKNKKHLLV